MKTLRQTLEGLIVELAASARPPERLSVSEAAERYRRLNNPGAYVGPLKNDMTPYLIEPMDTLQSRDFTGMVFSGPAQCAKALALDTPIPTPLGWTTMGEVKVGDMVFGSNGDPVRVLLAQPVQHDHQCFEVEFDDGSKIIADAGHRWAVRNCVSDWQRVVTTQDMVDAGTRQGKRARFRSRNSQSIGTSPTRRPPVGPLCSRRLDWRRLRVEWLHFCRARRQRNNGRSVVPAWIQEPGLQALGPASLLCLGGVWP